MYTDVQMLLLIIGNEEQARHKMDRQTPQETTIPIRPSLAEGKNCFKWHSPKIQSLVELPGGQRHYNTCDKAGQGQAFCNLFIKTPSELMLPAEVLDRFCFLVIQNEKSVCLYNADLILVNLRRAADRFTSRSHECSHQDENSSHP